jgi:predicted O-methyltransferase YrrM
MRSVTRYKVHSPFVFGLINNVFRDRSVNKDLAELNLVNQKYKKRKDWIETVDLGAGAGKNKNVRRKTDVGKVVRKRGHNRRQLEMLYRLSRHFKPNTILEFGTAAGISTLYLGRGNPGCRLISMEGCMGLASVAQSNFEKRNLVVQLEIGDFNGMLDQVLAGIDQLDMVFFDGNHRKKPTLRYFNSCLSLANEESVFLFDDIHWSKGMEKAWEMIKKDKRVTITIDLFWVGLVFFKKGVAKQDFVLRY